MTYEEKDLKQGHKTRSSVRNKSTHADLQILVPLGIRKIPGSYYISVSWIAMSVLVTGIRTIQKAIYIL